MPGIVAQKLQMTQLAKGDDMVPVTLLKVPKNVIGQIKTQEKDGYDAVVLYINDEKGKTVKMKEIPCTLEDLNVLAQKLADQKAASAAPVQEEKTEEPKEEKVEEKAEEKVEEKKEEKTEEAPKEEAAEQKKDDANDQPAEAETSDDDASEEEEEVASTPAPASTGLKVGDELPVDVLIGIETVYMTGTSKGKGFTGAMKRWNFSGGPGRVGSKFHRALGSIGTRKPRRTKPGKKMHGRHGNKTVSLKSVPVEFVDSETSVVALRGAVPGARNSFVYLEFNA